MSVFAILGEKHQNILLHGDEEPDDITVKLRTKTGAIWTFDVEWNGILGFMRDRYFKTESEAVREDIEKYMSPNVVSGLQRIAIQKRSAVG